ncbi:hypothetical protein BGZ80_004467 [Entomortierella chlamydospora]|uniref:Uncharacterized protein n=1 Tax=Entomortierella chlamydospora TaxID=101097 RepID=A0A9P6MMG5_9FUNG|nr:hypothetical protein BGZ79_001399 [Entomortierella chlamydospora]KAG0007598.1 hypothetical protein BGZ80_004467 [Entomortierella chlamydospora]
MRVVTWVLALNLLNIASTTLAYNNQHYDALVSGALFEGVNTADPDANRTSVFKDFKNHADAVASILIYSAKETSFDPSEKIHTRPEAYFDFLQKAASFPAFFYRGPEDREHELRLNGDPEQLLDQIADHYYRQEDYIYDSKINGYSDSCIGEGMKKKKENIREAFRKLIPKTVENKHWKQWVLSLVTIQKPLGSDEVTFDLAQVRLTISTVHDKTGRRNSRCSRSTSGGGGSGGCTVAIDRQVALLVKSSYNLVGGYTSFYSDEIARFIEKGTVDEFLRLMTTKQGVNVDTSEEYAMGFGRDRRETGSQRPFHV